VFSFAVLMFEVFSKAALPFQQMTDESLIQILPNPDVSLDGLLFADVRSTISPSLVVVLEVLRSFVLKFSAK
jgi:hypothetical protein